MIDLTIPNEWQHFDKDFNCVKPWYVQSFLDELDTWDLSKLKIFEYGLGASTLWHSKKCKELFGVDNDNEYFKYVVAHLNEYGNGSTVLLTCESGKSNYINSIYLNARYDIVVIDGFTDWRNECVKPAMDCLKENGILIIDNFQQPSVHMMNEENLMLLNKYETKIVYYQTGHPDWATAIFHN